MQVFMKTIAAAAALAGAMAAPGAFAQAKYPEKPISMIIPFGPGTVDTLSRLLAEALKNKLGQPIVVENKTGAFGNVGWGYIARAPGDGYTFGMISNSIMLAPYLYKLDFDPAKDIAPIARVADFYYVLMANKNLPVNSVKEFFDYARRQNPPMHFGHASTMSQISVAELEEASGVKFQGIPYKGGAELTRAVISGEVPAMFSIVTEAIGQAANLKVLGIASPRRVAQLPQVPILMDTVPGYQQISTIGYGAPGTMPRRIVEILNRELLDASNSEPIKSRMEKLGLDTVPKHEPEAYTKYLAAEQVRFLKAVKTYGLKAE